MSEVAKPWFGYFVGDAGAGCGGFRFPGAGSFVDTGARAGPKSSSVLRAGAQEEGEALLAALATLAMVVMAGGEEEDFSQAAVVGKKFGEIAAGAGRAFGKAHVKKWIFLENQLPLTGKFLS